MGHQNPKDHPAYTGMAGGDRFAVRRDGLREAPRLVAARGAALQPVSRVQSSIINMEDHSSAAPVRDSEQLLLRVPRMPTWFPHYAEEIERVTPVPRPPIEDPPLPHPPVEPTPDSPEFPNDPPDPLPID